MQTESDAEVLGLEGRGAWNTSLTRRFPCLDTAKVSYDSQLSSPPGANPPDASSPHLSECPPLAATEEEAQRHDSGRARPRATRLLTAPAIQERRNFTPRADA
jgi:hypothetical protein